MKKLKSYINALHLHPNFFLWGIGCVLLAFLSYYFKDLLVIACILIGVWLALTLIDIFLLFRQENYILAKRDLPIKLSNGDENPIFITIENQYPFDTNVEIVDEIPDQFQMRDLSFKLKLKSGERKKISYSLRPVKRGVYEFGNINVIAHSPLRLAKRKYSLWYNEETAVYPSFLQLRKYEIRAINQNLSLIGVKKIRRVGNNKEFEKIRDYAIGDDIRTINWKATAKRQHLMVNQYIEERAQPIYNVIDTGRSMKMPFEGMTLLDYSINSALVLSNIALQKFDQAGLICFSNEIHEHIPADRKGNQLNKILDALYNQKTRWLENNFAALQVLAKRKINRRCLFLIYTNFESIDSMYRQLPYLRSIAKQHVVVVVFFYNTEIKVLTNRVVKNTEDLYIKTIAEKFEQEKRQIVLELKKHGIFSILTTPQELTINTINKYLEIKSSGIL